MRPFIILAAIIASLSLTTPAPSPVAEPPPPALWLYYPTNLQVDENVDKLEPIWRRAANAGYTHILLADAKFARLGTLGSMQQRYHRNVERIKRIAAELNLQIVPALFHIGYSNSMLFHDPNLAEGLPVKDALFIVNDGEARLVPDPPVSLKPRPDWHDPTISITSDTATLSNPSGNSRMVFKLNVSPFRCYHISVRIKTENFTGRPEIKALAGDHSLQYQNLRTRPTQDWREHHVIFNSLENAQVNLYLGVWGDARGTMMWKDWKIEEVGLLNVLRRDGAPCIVHGYVEGQDYEPIADPRLGNIPYPGEYEVWHEPPSIRTKTIPDGTTLRVSWYHPAIIYDGQVSCCPLHAKTMALLADEAQRVRTLWNAPGYMMSHDEIRTMNWDHSCQRLGLDAGQILARNVRECTTLLEGADAYVWSDMFDPHHNAVKDYYLVRGDLARAWDGLDPRTIIMNWNFDKRDASLKFFAARGHRQIIAGYYDARPERIRDWLASAANVDGVVGIMYTTWQNNYADLETFARLCRP